MSQQAGGRQVILFVLLWLCGACLRLTVLAVPPVVPHLHADLHLSETGIGWLSSLPSMLFAIAAVPGALLIARFGLVRALLMGLLLNAVGSALRGAVLNAAVLYGSTIMMGAGISVMQPVMPPLVRAWFPQRIGFATAVYTNGLLVGEILAVALTIPLVLPLVGNSWRLTLVVWSVPVFATALLLMVCGDGAGRASNSNADATIVPTVATTGGVRAWWPDWKNSLIWRLGLLLGSVNAAYFVANAFLPDFTIAAGRPDLVSSALTAINLGQLPASFLMLRVAERLVRRPAAYVATGLTSFVSVIGILAMKGIWIVVWSGVLGFSGAATLILALALPSVLSTPADMPRTSAGMFTISYSCPMALSLLVGWLWDATHQPIVAFAPIGLCGLVIVTLASTVKLAGGERPMRR